jgi:hypothetical protein
MLGAKYEEKLTQSPEAWPGSILVFIFCEMGIEVGMVSVMTAL